MSLTKPLPSMVQNAQWVFSTVAEMQAAAGLVAGQRAITFGYHSVGDGGGNQYEIVAAATAPDDGGSFIDLATSGTQARGIFPDGVRISQFGAYGTGLVDDRAAVLATIGYMRTIRTEWYSDDRAVGGSLSDVYDDFFAVREISREPGKVFGMFAGVELDYRDRGLHISGNFTAIGGGWNATDLMFYGAGSDCTYVDLSNVHVNCNGLCSGVVAGSYWFGHRVTIIRMAAGAPGFEGFGIRFDGVQSVFSQVDIWEWTSNYLQFYNEANYGAIGVIFNGNDNKIVGKYVRWCKELVRRQAGVNNEAQDMHLYNGMENFRDYNLDGTYVGGGTGTAVGRTYNPLVVVEEVVTGGAYHPLILTNTYADNGTFEVYDDNGLDIIGIRLNSNIDHSRADQLYWIRNYASSPADVSRIVIENVVVGVDSHPKRLLGYFSHPVTGDTWLPNFALFMASASNLMDARNKTLSVAGRRDYYSSEDVMAHWFGQGPDALLKIRSNGSAANGVQIGAAADTFLVQSDAGNMTVQTIGGAASLTVTPTLTTVPVALQLTARAIEPTYGNVAISNGSASTNGFGTAGPGLYVKTGATWARV